MAGYCQCIVEGSNVATSIIKYDPNYLKYYSSYALMDAILSYYVRERNMMVSNGTRAIAHDTNIQDYLLKFGFRREYCRLNVFYQPLVGMAVKVLYPFRRFLKLMPDDSLKHKVEAVLYQEQLRREGNAFVV